MKEYSLEELKKLLSESTRAELRDHAFGDREIYWTHPTLGSFAEGYSGHGIDTLFIFGQEDDGYEVSESDEISFKELFKLGTLGAVERNDSTGPDEFIPGQTMEGLTTEGVLKELTDGKGNT